MSASPQRIYMPRYIPDLDLYQQTLLDDECAPQLVRRVQCASVGAPNERFCRGSSRLREWEGGGGCMGTE